MMAPFHGTQTNFIDHEIGVWGIDYVTDLFNKGYDAIYTTAGWKWQLPVTVAVDVEGLSRKLAPIR